ncbi:sulfurtransferase-like selenium metabolism protein YedF [Desulfoplanes formicivorans]|uniref:SirA family protein n=1 Tax=Desulfoplanes formicivorans TaxID=1592317 RepID=A0A194AKG0_9BACT|nr:sulfurtransferase-like selenium metabolism protein YedF [Desulfoplanes formicivorans]GAU09199.1 SirA family protein [Desulfoplanes formicivorans]
MSCCTLTCQGLPCPQPVLQCKQAIEKEPGVELVVYVDNDAAKENVTRFVGTKGYEVVSAEKDGAVWKIMARPGAGMTTGVATGSQHVAKEKTEQGNRTLVFISSSCMGSGDDELGHKLMGNFISVLPELGDDLWRIILVNAGVKLAVEGSPVLANLQALEAQGVSILVCGTCLDFFDLLQQKKVGETTNMLDVVTSMQLADKVLSI